MDRCDVAIIGAGPYGLSVAAHLRQSKWIDLRVLGEPMSFWERHMPQGMLLRSPRVASNLSDPRCDLTLDRYEKATGGCFSIKVPATVREEFIARDMAKKVPLQDFIKYGRWFLQQADLPIDPRIVSRVELAAKGFRLVFEDGKSLNAEKVIVAGGVAPFARIPEQFADLPPCLASHTSQHNDLGRFRDKEVVIIGGGQSALESAALLDEAGAHVEVLIREPSVRWLGMKRRWMHGKAVGWALYGPADVGPPGVSLLVQRPSLYRHLPRAIQDWWARRSIRPAASCWVKARTAGVLIHAGQFVVWARPEGERVRVRLNDGAERLFDHVLLGTGYRIEIARYPFLSAQVLEKLERVDGFPVLDKGFESSLSGMHFVGAPAAWSFGPLLRFVAGAEFASRAVAHRVLRVNERRRNVTPEAIRVPPCRDEKPGALLPRTSGEPSPEAALRK